MRRITFNKLQKCSEEHLKLHFHHNWKDIDMIVQYIWLDAQQAHYFVISGS